MYPTPRRAILLLAAFFLTASSPKTGLPEQPDIPWQSKTYAAVQNDGSTKNEAIPEYFWAYQQHHHKVSPKAWTKLKDQMARIERDRANSESKQAHNLFVETEKSLKEAIASGDEAEKGTSAVIASVKKDLGSDYSSKLDRLFEQVQLAGMKKAREPQSAEMKKKGAALEKADAKGKKDALDAQFENGRAGKEGGAADGKTLATEVGKLKGGGQLTDAGAGRAQSKYGSSKEPPGLQKSLFSVGTAPEGVGAGGYVFSGKAPMVSAEDRSKLNGDFNKLKELESGKRVMADVEKGAPGMLPQQDKRRLIDNLSAYAENDASAITTAGYKKAAEGNTYFANKPLPGAAGVTFYDTHDTKNYVALDPSLRNADQGVRLAVLTDEMGAVRRQQARATQKQQALAPAVELEKADRLAALQVYHEYYYKNGATPPQNTDLERKLYDQHQKMMNDRPALMAELDSEYKGNRGSTHNKTLDQLRAEQKADMWNKIPYYDLKSSQAINASEKYYQDALRENDEWLRNNR